MDVQRSGVRKRQYKRHLQVGAVAVGVLVLGWLAFSVTGRPAAVDAELVWSGEVKRGEFVHEVTGAGSLIAVEIRTVTNRSDGVVERILVLPGREVGPDDVLVELSSSTLPDDLAKARSTLEQAEAQDHLDRAKAEDDYLNQQVQVAGYESDYTAAQYELDAQKKLADLHVTSDLEMRKIEMQAEQLKRRLDAAQLQLKRYPETRKAQEAASDAKLAQQRRDFSRLQEQISELKVRAGVAGVVKSIDVEEGRRVATGTQIARVVNPHNLLARVRVSERDAALVQEGQVARLEMGRDTITGRVTRVEPTVQDRLVTVDIALDDHSRSLRPDLTVTARIEIDRVADTLVLDRPAGLRDDQTSARLFRLEGGGNRAQRVEVQVGRVSTRQIEISRGLAAGDRVILADMTESIDEPEIRIR